MIMYPAEDIWGQCEFNLSSTRVWTSCCDVALLPQSVLASAWLNLGLRQASKTGTTKLPLFFLFLLQQLKYTESRNMLIEFTFLNASLFKMHISSSQIKKYVTSSFVCRSPLSKGANGLAKFLLMKWFIVVKHGIVFSCCGSGATEVDLLLGLYEKKGLICWL